MPAMKKVSDMVSFRHTSSDIRVAEEICANNGIDLTSYIVASLVHYVHAKAAQGEIEMPNFLRERPMLRRRAPKNKKAQA